VDHGLVFATRLGTPLDAANVRKQFKAICKVAGLGESWTPRELRTSFVSLLSWSAAIHCPRVRPAGERDRQ
jgi:site-specific recombinase XerC